MGKQVPVNNWLSPPYLSHAGVAKQHDKFVHTINFGEVMIARARFWLDEITRELVERFPEDFPKPELLLLTALLFKVIKICCASPGAVWQGPTLSYLTCVLFSWAGWKKRRYQSIMFQLPFLHPGKSTGSLGCHQGMERPLLNEVNKIELP